MGICPVPKMCQALNAITQWIFSIGYNKKEKDTKKNNFF